MRIIVQLLVILAVFCSLMIAGCIGSGGDHLKIAVPDSARDDLAKLVSNYSDSATKIELVSLPENASATNYTVGAGVDLVICDMHDVSGYAQKNQFEQLNPVLSNGTSLNWSTIERPVLLLYGEYPSHSGKIYALPFDPDALGIVYRQDLLTDPKEMEAFCQTYGHELSLPGSYLELQTLAEFFNRPEKNLSGIGVTGLAGPNRDENPFLSIFASQAGRIQDPSSGNITGYLNGESFRIAADQYKNLTRFSSSGVNWSDADLTSAFLSGNLSMAFVWISDTDSLISKMPNSTGSVGVMPLPGSDGVSGSFNRGIQVRGLSIGLSSSSPHKKEALAFLQWFYSPSTQVAWMNAGHQPVSSSVQNSFTYLSHSINNRLYPESLRVGVDLWHSPRYDQMAEIWHSAVQGIFRNNSVDLSGMNRAAEELDAIRSQT